MSRYVDEDAVIKAVDKHTVDGDGFSYLDDDISCILEELPTADVKPVVRGKNLLPCAFECDQCGFKTEYHGFEMYFCPNCGADMRGESGEKTNI